MTRVSYVQCDKCGRRCYTDEEVKEAGLMHAKWGHDCADCRAAEFSEKLFPALAEIGKKLAEKEGA